MFFSVVCCFLVFPPLAVQSQSDLPWSQDGHDAQHTFNSQAPLLTQNASLGVSWEAFVGSPHTRLLVGVSQGKPAVLAVAKPDQGGELIANSFVLDTGENLWTAPLGIYANKNIFDVALDSTHLFVASIYLEESGGGQLHVACIAVDNAAPKWTFHHKLDSRFYTNGLEKKEPYKGGITLTLTVTESALIVTASFNMFALKLNGRGETRGKILWALRPPFPPSPFSPPCSPGVNLSSTFNGPASFDAVTGNFIVSTGFFSDSCYSSPPPSGHRGVLAPSVLWVSSNGTVLSTLALPPVDFFSVNASDKSCFTGKDCLVPLASPVALDHQGTAYLDTLSNGLVALRASGAGNLTILWNYTGGDWVLSDPSAPLNVPVVDGSHGSGVYFMKFTGEPGATPLPSIVRLSLAGHLISSATHSLLSTLAQLVFFPSAMALFYPPSNTCFGVASSSPSSPSPSSSSHTLDTFWGWDTIPGDSTTLMVGPSPRLVSVYNFRVSLLSPLSSAIGTMEIILITSAVFFVLAVVGTELGRRTKLRCWPLAVSPAVSADSDDFAEPLLVNPALN